jgi:RimJ/RimL family protein N-acetyltransferase
MTTLLLQTKRLKIREFAIDDWLAVHSYASDPDVTKYVEWGPNSETDSKNFVDWAIQSSTIQPRLDFEFALSIKPEQILIGAASLHVSNPTNREGWLGYCLNKRFWNRGFAKEAAQALIVLGFQNLDRIEYLPLLILRMLIQHRCWLRLACSTKGNLEAIS